MLSCFRCDGPSALYSASDVQLLGKYYLSRIAHGWLDVPHPLQAKKEDTLDLCRLLNNDLAATVAKHPTRFVGLGTLPMQAPDLAVKELERCVKVKRSNDLRD